MRLKSVFLDLHYLTMKKYEIYIPVKYNDGKEIEPRKLERISERLMAVFGAVTVSPVSAPYRGIWRYGGVQFIDKIIRIEVITSEELSSRRFFKKFKHRLKRTLRQLDILITAQDIERI
jgi:hypothetical protein